MLALSRPLTISFTIAGLMLAAIVLADLLMPVPPQQKLRAMRQELVLRRAAADSCRSAIETEERRLQASDVRFDSLRSVIQRYEGLDPRGVPADSYEVYLDAFNAYNEGIPAREAAGEALQVNWDACIQIVEHHNQLADSARRFAQANGLIDDSVRRVPAR
ncbi:MAG TPA: hypothetical protein VLC48_09650 [Gemmatimonadota bacterium]|nr:hypothetical protein [Gemmatimonadota bacterium]